MNKTTLKFFILAFIILIMFIPISANAATFNENVDEHDSVYIVPYGREIGVKYEENESLTSSNENICKVESAGKLQIVGVGKFTLTSKKGEEEKQLNFFAWNVCLKKDGYTVFSDVNKTKSDGDVYGKTYFAISKTSVEKSFKIEEHLFTTGRYTGSDLNGKYITSHYNEINDSSDVNNFVYALDNKFDQDDDGTQSGGDPQEGEDEGTYDAKIKLGDTYTPKSEGSLTWVVENEDILKIEDAAKGKVRGIRVGTTTLTGKSGNTNKVELKIKVYREKGQTISVERIELDKTSITLKKDEVKTKPEEYKLTDKEKINATVVPSYADNRKVTWESSNRTVATVSNQGRIKPISAGDVTITASTENRTSAVCKVTIVDNNESGGGSEETGSSDNLEIHFISPPSTVDAIYIKVGDKSAYIDGGHYSDTTKEIEYLKKLGVTHIDYYICSHSHNNHVGAGGPIIYTFGIKKIYLGREQQNGKYASYNTIISAINSKCPKATKEKMLNAVKSCEIVVVKPGDTFSINDLNIKCIGPIKLFSVSNDENENSIVLRLQYKNNSFLLGGDMEKSGWVEIIKKYPNDLKVDLMKHTHHGHTSSTKVEWYNTYFKPEYVVFTTSKSCLPKSSYLSKLNSYGIKCYITTPNKQGNVFVKSNGKKITIKSNYNP